jgi:alkane 1-monooxygenase
MVAGAGAHVEEQGMIPRSQVAELSNAIPFWISLGLVPLAILGATQGGWTLILLPLAAWWLTAALDALAGLNLENADPETPEDDLFWYRLLTMIWFPIQFCLIFGMIAYATTAGHLSGLEKILLFFGVGVASGTVGIVFSHELMHQKNRLERWLADLLLATVLYSHFRSEHLLVHHRYVGTPRDAVTARYNEGFHRYFFRVLPESYVSAFREPRRRGSPGRGGRGTMRRTRSGATGRCRAAASLWR